MYGVSKVALKYAECRILFREEKYNERGNFSPAVINLQAILKQLLGMKNYHDFKKHDILHLTCGTKRMSQKTQRDKIIV